MAKEQKTETRIGITSRYLSEEIAQLDWLSNRWGCDRANTPRHLLAAYLTANPELKDACNLELQTKQGIKEMIPDRVFSTDRELNDKVNAAIREHCSSIKEAISLVNKALMTYTVDAVDACGEWHTEGDLSVPPEKKEAFVKNGFANAVLEAIDETKRYEDWAPDAAHDRELDDYLIPLNSAFNSCNITVRPAVLKGV